MVVVTNGGHSCCGRHSSPHAPFCTVLGDSWSWAAECSSRVRVAGRGSAKEILLFALPEQEGALRVGHVASGWFGGAVRWLLHSGWHKLIPESQNDDEMAAHGDEHAAFRTAMGLGPEEYRPRPRVIPAASPAATVPTPANPFELDNDSG